MSKASGLGTFTVGAILAFAIHASLKGVSITVVGVIFMTVGVVSFVAGIYRDRWRERVVMGALDSGTPPPAGFRHGELIIERSPSSSSRDFLVQQHLVTPEVDLVGDLSADDGSREFDGTREFPGTAMELPEDRSASSL